MVQISWRQCFGLFEQKIKFPAVDVYGGPNITTVDMDENLVWQNVGLDFKGKTPPKIQFVLGPVDSVVGSMDSRDGNVMIDVGELSLTPESMLGQEADLDRLLTSTIAHEARHRWQLAQWGYWGMIWDKYAIIVVSSAVLILLGNQLFHRSLLFVDQTVPALYPRLALSLALGIGWVSFIYKFYRRVLPVLVYKWCRTERDARRYAKTALSDPRWSPVVTVVRQHLMQSFPHLPTTNGGQP